MTAAAPSPDGPAELEYVRCDLCGSTEQRNVVDRPVGLTVGECADCGLAYVNPRPTWEAMLAHYRSTYVVNEVANRGGLSLATGEYRRDVRRIRATVELEGISALDIGCGGGEFLDTLHRYGVSRLVGLEPGLAAARSALRLVPTAIVQPVTYEEAILSPSSFDLVAALNVIEHVYSPTRFLAFVYRVLKPGGYVYITTPNWDAARKYGKSWHGLNGDFEHVSYFNLCTIRHCLEKGGFNLVLADYEPFTGGLGSSQVKKPASPGGVGAIVGLLKACLYACPPVSRLCYGGIDLARRTVCHRDIVQGTSHEMAILARKGDL